MGFIRMGTICAGACIALAALGGCTPGAAVAPSQNAASSNATIIGMSLLKYGQSQSPLGFVQAYNPAFVTIAVGSAIQFHNDDGFAHTATMISGSFPNSNPFQTVALTASGSDLAAAAWSTGDIPGNGFSQILRASQPGTYLYGCYHHYPMRGVIVVQ